MTFDQLPAEQKEKIIKAIDSLFENNDDLVNQLTKLAEVKNTKPFIWNMALKNLK